MPVRRLGAGAVGVVWEALDRGRGVHVAVKTLRDLDADGIYALKREFRALADVVHPNLVRLHELFSAGERWFFSMDLVAGVDLLTWVRPHDLPTLLPSGELHHGFDEGRLRAALRQLAAGVVALHAAGKIHRDIKPSNALVTPQGRVVLLDFGLVTDVALNRLFQTADRRLVGTPAYLAPEQAAQRPLTAACDWYAVGALLYEALTGRPPFSGNLVEILVGKQERDPPRPRALSPEVPADLDDLAMALLARDPARRPSDDEVLRRFGQEPTLVTATGRPSVRGPDPLPWVGRRAELGALDDAAAAVDRGRPVLVALSGTSGLGKSALLERFLDRLLTGGARDGRELVVLAGRCYEREEVPYRALDNLVDALTRYLARLSRAEVEALLPRDTQALVRVFPVLERVDALAAPPRRRDVELDPPELRRRAFAGLRELLGRLADRKRLVLAIDDLQWGDPDSAALLRHLFAPPDAPLALAVFAFRTEDEASVCVRALRGAPGEEPIGGGDADRRELRLEPLGLDDARELALRLLGRRDTEARELADRLGGESGGSPFFVEELVVYARQAVGASSDGGGAAAPPTLEEVLRERVLRLPERPRRLLETLAVAGRPLGRDRAAQATGISAGDDEPLAFLRAARLVTTRGSSDVTEIAHDRLRITVLAAMAPGRVRDVHKALAVALAAAPDVDPEQLAIHLEAAGESRRAGLEAARAAARADQALAFDRAVDLWRKAIALQGGDTREASPLRARLGEALANQGKGADAATAFLDAAVGASAALALEMRRRAAEQLLRVGRLDEGLEALGTVLLAIGARLENTSFRAMVSLGLRRLRIRLRGLGWTAREPGQISAEDLTRLDIYWSVATSLGIIDNVLATDFQARHLLLALRLGEPYRLARALAAEVVYSSIAGTRATARTAHLLRAAEAIAAQVDRPFARGWATLAAGMAAYWEGRFEQAVTLNQQAEEVFRGCTGVWWETGSAQLFSLWALFYRGELRELCRRQPRCLQEADARGDAYTATNLRSSILAFVWLVADDPARAEAEVDEAMRSWSRRGYHAQHFWHMIAFANARLYRGDPVAAWERIERDRDALRGALVLRVQVGRIEATDLRGRVALACAAAASAGARSRWLRSARRAAGELQREGTPWAQALAALLRAGDASLAQTVESERAAGVGTVRREVERALAGFESLGMKLHAAVARAWLADLDTTPGAAEGSPSPAAWFTAEGVRNPRRLMATLAPGFVGNV